MDSQAMDHVSTLCALGTIGAGAAGLAFGFEDHALPTRPGSKRKASSTGPPISRRVISQPVPSTASYEVQNISLFRRRTIVDSEKLSTRSTTTTAQSRQSSPGGRYLSQSTSGDSNNVAEKRGTGPVYWLRRMSSLSGSPVPSIRPTTPSISLSNTSATPILPGGQSNTAPNKLVKRSSSHRILSADRTSLPALRRPATSHQRSATLQQFSTRCENEKSDTSNLSDANHRTLPVWRPYFDSGSSLFPGIRPRKRHTSGAISQGGIRTISDSPGRPPTLLLGTSIEARPAEDADDMDARGPQSTAPAIRQRLRRSLSNARARRRHVSEPVRPANPDTESPRFRDGTSPLSPMSRFSAFEVELPRGTPSYPSSPFPDAQQLRSPLPNARVSRPKRVSMVPSDPNSITLSSDNDTRVFTDDESMDFQSDTAYDSLATRATASSHSGLRGTHIETIFDESPPSKARQDVVTLEDLITSPGLSSESNGYRTNEREPSTENTGIGISGFELDDYAIHEARAYGEVTPNRPRKTSFDDENMATPVTVKINEKANSMNSSPPVTRMSPNQHHQMLQQLQWSMDGLAITGESDEDDDLHPFDGVLDNAINLPDLADQDTGQLASISEKGQPRFALAFGDELPGRTRVKKASIFDWSEHHKFDGDSITSSSHRPKTVHGKHGNDVRGSRAPGRRGPSAMHLRSQSVPVQRESLNENDMPHTAAKFGTWGLGNKGVSEEWNDDFDFEDMEDEISFQHEDHESSSGTLRRMKVPQAIIDRQDSVHGQFGQVQEFMLLVEELKRLRVQGVTLKLLESESRQLWEDAESIINLATLNDDDEILPPSYILASPSFDEFDEDSLPPNRVSKRRDSTPRRSMSNPATPPFGRPRGESLAQTKSFLQNIHQKRNGPDSSPHDVEAHHHTKLPFDTQDLRDLVVKAGMVTRALKDIIRQAEGVSLSPEKAAKPFSDPSFSQIFVRPDHPSPTKTDGLLQNGGANEHFDAPLPNVSGNDIFLGGRGQFLS